MNEKEKYILDLLKKFDVLNSPIIDCVNFINDAKQYLSGDGQEWKK